MLHKMIRRYAFVLVGVLILIGGAARSDEPIKIRSGWLVVPSSIEPLMELKKDVLKHYGQSYVIEPVHFSGTAPQITSLASNDLETSGLSFSALGLAITNARLDDIRIIADQGQDGADGYGTNEFMVLADGPIHAIEDLKGKVLASNGIGGAVDMAMRVMMRKHGLDEKRDYTVIEIALPNMKSALTDNRVALITELPPFSFDPELRKVGRTLFTQKDALGKSQVIVLTARAGFIAGHRAAMVDFLEDHLRALAWYSSPANHAASVKLIADYMKQTPDKLDWVYTTKDTYRPLDGKPDLDALQSNMNALQELGFLNRKINVRDYADLSLLDEAAKRLK